MPAPPSSGRAAPTAVGVLMLPGLAREMVLGQLAGNPGIAIHDLTQHATTVSLASLDLVVIAAPGVHVRAGEEATAVPTVVAVDVEAGLGQLMHGATHRLIGEVTPGSLAAAVLTLVRGSPDRGDQIPD